MNIIKLSDRTSGHVSRKIKVEVFSNCIFFSAKTSSCGLKTQKKIKIKKLGGGGVFFPTKICFRGGGFGVFGARHAPTRGSRGVGKRYTSSYDHDM